MNNAICDKQIEQLHRKVIRQSNCLTKTKCYLKTEDYSDSDWLAIKKL